MFWEENEGLKYQSSEPLVKLYQDEQGTLTALIVYHNQE